MKTEGQRVGARPEKTTVVDLNVCVIGVGFQLQLGEHIFVLTPACGHSGPHGISMPLRALFLSPDQCSHGSFSIPCLCALMRALLAWHSFCPLVSILCLCARMWALLAWRSFWPLVLPLWVPVRPLFLSPGRCSFGSFLYFAFRSPVSPTCMACPFSSTGLDHCFHCPLSECDAELAR